MQNAGSPLPSLFVPHGAPTFALAPGVAGTALQEQIQALPTPRALVVVSAHWETGISTVGTAASLETIHDFRGFPAPLYQIRYPASGCVEAAREVAASIAQMGQVVREDERRGLDHGAWIPLRLMYPNADIPVVPLSLRSAMNAEQAYLLGQALHGLTRKGFLVIGSGNITHNLDDFRQASLSHSVTPPEYVRRFADWMYEQAAITNISDLLNYRTQAPGAMRAHPTEEHLMPFYVALGAAGVSPNTERFHEGINDYVIAMDAYRFTPQ